MIEPQVGGRRPWERRAGRALDVVGAVIGLVLVAPVLLVAVIALRLEREGPALFRQERVGLHGRRFVLYKLRTMRPGGDDAPLRELIARELRGEDTMVDGSTKLVVDGRSSRLGRILRRTSFDEVPQLINVLRGEMSLVGPRPCLAWEAEMFPEWSAVRFAVKPGMTGLWQVTGRSTLGTADMLRLDVDYVASAGFVEDLRILWRTVPSLIGSAAR